MLSVKVLLSILHIKDGQPTDRGLHAAPRAFCAVLEHFKTSVNLSYDDKREKNWRVQEPKTLHATMKRAFVGPHRNIFRLITG